MMPLRHLRLATNSLMPKAAGARHELFLARAAIFHAIEMLGIGPTQTVLVPAYICTSAVDPILAAGARIEYYRIDRKCEVDLADIRKRIRPQTAALLVVHYFGFPAPVNRLRKLCDEHGVALIEDCAHVLSGGGREHALGTFGDVSVFSWRKFIPVYEGGGLLVNRPEDRFCPDLSPVPATVSLRSASHAASSVPVIDAAKRRLRSILKHRRSSEQISESITASTPDIFETYTDEFEPDISSYQMTRPTRWILRHVDISRIAALRRANFESLAERLADTPGISLLHEKPPPGGAAWVFPIVVNAIRDAHKLLRKLGIPATAWDGVRPAQLDTGFEDAEFLYHHLVFLPVHQGLQAAHLDRIAVAVQRLSSNAARSTV
jgi:dTDP-4-amino-4,6-dideoxygalactose transaminase